LVDTNILSTLIQQAPPPVAAAQPPPQQQPQYQPAPAGYPPYGAPPVPQGFPPGYAPTPPLQQQQAYQPPPPQQAAPPMPQGQDGAAMMQTVLALTREQIMGLDEGSRNQVLALRQSFGAPPLF